jgi:hypothetical protein
MRRRGSEAPAEPRRRSTPASPCPTRHATQILAGDVVGAVLAIVTIIALRYRARIAIGLAWLLAVETALDLAMGSIGGVNEHLFETASAVTWLILVFYVPLLWVTLGLIVWQLSARRGEPLGLGWLDSPELEPDEFGQNPLGVQAPDLMQEAMRWRRAAFSRAPATLEHRSHLLPDRFPHLAILAPDYL